MLPKDFAGGPVTDAEHVTRFCGGCAFFEVWALGGGGDCHKGHDCLSQARRDACADKTELTRSHGPLFDLSE